MDPKLINFIKVESDQFESKSIQFIKDIIRESISSRDIAVVGLSGGSTPKPIYEKLGHADTSIQWQKVYFFAVDERYIEKSSKDSIYYLISNSIFSNRSELLSSNFVTPDTSLPLKECIAKYESDLKQLVSKSGGAPDLVTLGMGEDGHIASIFPNASVSPLDRNEMVYHTTTERFAIFDRITTNIHFLSSARSKVFFMSGANKKVVWDEMFNSQENTIRWPAHSIIQSGNTNVIYRD